MDQRFRRGLLGLVALGALSQWLIQAQAFSENPMVLVPQSDAAVIWDRAGEIAAGEEHPAQPFDTAPLLVWVAALVRWLGGGLGALGGLQSLLHVATAPLIALATRRIGGPRAGLLAGGLYLLLQDPAATTSRVLSGSLQLFLAAALLERVTATSTRGSRPAVIGGLLGVLCLAYPPMLAAIPVAAVWAYFRSAKRPAAGLLLAGAALLAISPATVHNYRTSRELIPISTQAGLTFYHGNNAEADGMIAPVGVVNSKEEQAADSLRRARTALGRDDAGWKDASAYWRDQGLAWWGENPVAGVQLALRKLWFAISGQRYGDVYQPWRERDDGVASRLWLAPLPAAWIIPLALLVLFVAVRERSSRAAAAPLALLLIVPIAVIVVFFYSPRYRMPSLIAAAPLAALGLAGLRPREDESGGTFSPAPLAVGAALVLGGLSGTLNRAAGLDVDTTGQFQDRFLERMAKALGQLDQHGRAAGYLRGLVAVRPDDPALQGRLFDLTWFLAASADPTVFEPAAGLQCAEFLIESFGPAPGLLDLRGVAKAALGDFAGALDDVNTALRELPAESPARPEMEARAKDFRSGRAFRLPPPTN